MRAYEARWLAGRLAAMNSKRGVAGYVAGFPVPEVVQGINAFALGMRSVNPKATVRVVWLNSWFDPAREREAALTLVNQGADVLANHTASPAVATVGRREAGAADRQPERHVGFAPQGAAGRRDAALGRLLHAGGARRDRRPLEGRAGVGRPALGHGEPGGHRSQAAAAPDQGARSARAVRSPTSAVPMFAAPLVDQAGRTRLDQGALDDEAIAKMDWLVQGVIGSMPTQ